MKGMLSIGERNVYDLEHRINGKARVERSRNSSQDRKESRKPEQKGKG